MARRRLVRPALQAILENIRVVREAVADLSFEDYARDVMRRYVVERGVEIISEASRRVPKHLLETRPEIPWAQIAGIGNVLRHEYDAIVEEVIFRVATKLLDPLQAAVLGIESTLDEPLE